MIPFHTRISACGVRRRVTLKEDDMEGVACVRKLIKEGGGGGGGGGAWVTLIQMGWSILS